jgi:hypothetical protein
MKTLSFNKNKILAGSLLIAISTLVSCKKLIQIPPNPPTQITRTEQFADSASTMSAVAGVYTYIYGGGSGGIPYSDANLTIATSLSAHEIDGGYGDEAQFYSYTLTPLNNEITTLWGSPYQAMYQVNDVLNGITNNNNLSASFIKQITAEMEVTRAFYYFNLVNLFGGVPLVTSINYTATAQLPKASVAAVYTQILTDLTDATKKLTAAYPVYISGASSGHARPNLYTALALLAKVHLYQGQWQAAYSAADSVIKFGGFSLETNLNNVFLDGSQEAIWQLPNENSSTGTAEASNFLPYSSGQTPTFVVTDSLLAQFETGDQRKTNWLGTSIVPVSSTQNDTLYYPAKYQDRVPTSPATDYMMLRLAEMYLIRAEAAAELNTNLSVAVADINTIRLRAGLTAVNPTTQTAILAAVRKERRTEMCFEWGNRWFDLNRTVNDAKYPSNGQAAAVLTGYQSFDALYPLPQTQIQLNSHLIQNPGYH